MECRSWYIPFQNRIFVPNWHKNALLVHSSVWTIPFFAAFTQLRAQEMECSGLFLNQGSHSFDKAEIAIVRDQDDCMETSHLLILLGILGTVLAILVRLAVILMLGATRAAASRSGSSNKGTWQFPEVGQNDINWREINALPVAPPVPEKLYQRLLKNLKLPPMPWRAASPGKTPIMAIHQEMLADPVDGTLFHAGENILRCACGTSYHTQSWQWIGEKNGGKCVSCKRVGSPISVAV